MWEENHSSLASSTLGLAETAKERGDGAKCGSNLDLVADLLTGD